MDDAMFLPSPAMFQRPCKPEPMEEPPMPCGLVAPSKLYEHSRIQEMPIEHYDHYLAIIMLENGSFEFRSSITLKSRAEFYLQEAARLLRLDYFGGGTSADHDSLEAPTPSPRVGPPSDMRSLESSVGLAFPIRQKRRRIDSQASSPGVHDHGTALRTSSGLRESKRSQPRREVAEPRQMLTIRVDETQKWIAWFTDAFKVIQQQACRCIAKEWIKAIHPKKQSTHPYNGNIPKFESRSPERTKPDYWPANVRHKEPDHIDKNQRTALLVHLLMNTPQHEVEPSGTSDKYYTAKDLLKVLKKKQDLHVIDKWKLIQTVCDVRSRLEAYADGGCGADDIINVPDYSECIRSTIPGKPNDRRKADPRTGDESDDEDEGNGSELAPVFTPSTSSETSASGPARVGVHTAQPEATVGGLFRPNISEACLNADQSFTSHAASLPTDTQQHMFNEQQEMMLPSQLQSFAVGGASDDLHRPYMFAQAWPHSATSQVGMGDGFREGNPAMQSSTSMLEHHHFNDSDHVPHRSQIVTDPQSAMYQDSQAFPFSLPHEMPRDFHAGATHSQEHQVCANVRCDMCYLPL